MNKFLKVISSIETFALIGFLTCELVQAQIIPDNTLPNNSEIIQEENRSTIEEGTTRGNNLFHSFEQFSLPTGTEALFNNASNIQNIFSRVTGSSISNIDGILRANSTANLFFLNPNGIIFGENARLDLGGSFIGSTADRIVFADGFEFSASNPDESPLLTVEVPIGLGFGSSPGAIDVQNNGHNFSGPIFDPVTRLFNSEGLQVKPDKNLALIGGDLNLEGGILRAPGGQVTLGSVNNGIVNIDISNKALNFEEVSSFKDIRLIQRAVVDTSGVRPGSIQIHAQNIELSEGSIMSISNFGRLPSGTLSLIANDSIRINGTDSIARIPSGLRTEGIAGNGGNINISANQLQLFNGGGIQANSFGEANAGNIILNIAKNLEIVGASPRDFRALSNVSSLSSGTGNSGSIIAQTEQFLIRNGGLLQSTILGTGIGGNIEITVNESLELSGFDPNTFTPSAITTATFLGNAGDLIINTPKLFLRDGGRIGSATVASGNAGNVLINAFQSAEIQGRFSGSRNPSLVISSANILDEPFRQVYNIPGIPLLTGNSGNVAINTPRLTILDEASLSVINEGTGNAGSLEINAQSLNLSNSASISATTASGQGGDITIDASDIQLNDSTITATAGGTGDGGDITINTDTLTTFNSDITANAFKGNGGNILINAQGLFQSPGSEITASSELGIDGTVTINTPDSNVQKDLEIQPNNALNPEELVTKSCLDNDYAERGEAILINAGNESLPDNPDNTTDQFDLSQLDRQPTTPPRQPAPSERNRSSQPDATTYISSAPRWQPGKGMPIIRSTEVIRTTDGLILFVAPSDGQVRGVDTLTCH